MTVAGRTARTKCDSGLSTRQILSVQGFRPLLSLHKQLRQGGGRLIFCQLTEVVHGIFEVTRFGRAPKALPSFDVFATVSAAIDSIK